jgi:hypothetical protein
MKHIVLLLFVGSALASALGCNSGSPSLQNKPDTGQSSGVDSQRANLASQPEAKTVQIVGRVLEVHMLGEKEETVTVCHFDPRYVVTVETESGAKKLGIHSPAQTFMGENPVGRSYRFYLSKTNNQFYLEKVEVMGPDKTVARDVP